MFVSKKRYQDVVALRDAEASNHSTRANYAGYEIECKNRHIEDLRRRAHSSAESLGATKQANKDLKKENARLKEALEEAQQDAQKHAEAEAEYARLVKRYTITVKNRRELFSSTTETGTTLILREHGAGDITVRKHEYLTGAMLQVEIDSLKDLARQHAAASGGLTAIIEVK